MILKGTELMTEAVKCARQLRSNSTMRKEGKGDRVRKESGMVATIMTRRHRGPGKEEEDGVLRGK